MSLLIAERTEDGTVHLLSDGLAFYEGGLVAETDFEKWIVSPCVTWGIGVAGSGAIVSILRRYLADGHKKIWDGHLPDLTTYKRALLLLDECRECLVAAGVDFKHEDHAAGGCGSDFLIATSCDGGHIWHAAGDMRSLYPKGDFAAIGVVFDIAVALHDTGLAPRLVFEYAARRHTKVGKLHRHIELRKPDAGS